MAPAAARHGEWIIEGVKDVERERESYIYDGSSRNIGFAARG